MKQKQKRKLPKRNFLVPLVVKKTGAGKHRNRKKDSRNQPIEKDIYND